MRSEIIITIKDAAGSIGYDLEVPTDIPAGALIENIKETLISFNSSLAPLSTCENLYSERLGEELPHDRTLGFSGIWNGDILVLK